MRTTTRNLMVCPRCRGELEWLGTPGRPDGTAPICPSCRVAYPVHDGIVEFVRPEAVGGLNGRLSGLYDWFSHVYDPLAVLAFRLVGLDQATARGEVTDRLDPHGDAVLEVSVGTGANLPHLVGRRDVGGIVGLDISPGQLARCRRLLRRKGWEADLVLGNGERLPFRDASFGAVLHVGGINFFDDRAAAMAEMARVARPGARVVVVDETERGARAYEKLIPGFAGSFVAGRPPVVPPLDAVPAGMDDVVVREIWNGWAYSLEFRTPAGVAA